MAIRTVLRMGHPLLRQKAKEIKVEEIQSQWVTNLIQDMIETMHSEEGVGIAAPQIGESVRLSIIEYSDENERYPEMGSQGLSVYINPVLTVLEEEAEGFWEGCLSVPGLRGFVERPRKVSVEYYDESGKKKNLVAEGFLAVVLQHEFDHLDGVIYVDRVKDLSKLSYIEEYREFILKDDDKEV